MRMKACVLGGMAAIAVTAAMAAPASAEPNTGVIIGDAINAAANIAGCHVNYSVITVVTVFNPLSPTNKLAVVSVPLVTNFGCP